MKLQYELGQVVYMRTDPQQEEYLVTGAIIRPGAIQYLITSNGIEHVQYAFEISKDRNKLKTLGVDNVST